MPGECRLGARASDEPTRQRCSWTSPSAFELRWTADELRLTVAGMTLRHQGQWRADDVLRISAVRDARVTVETVGGRHVGAVVNGRPMPAGPVDLVLNEGRDSSGWTVTGTIERRGGGSIDDAVLMSLVAPGSRTDLTPRPFLPTGAFPALPPPAAKRARIGGAQEREWIGDAGPLWSTPQNWDPEGRPQSGDALVFPKSKGTTETTNDLPGVAVGSVTVEDGYTITGEGLHLQAGGTSVIKDALTVSALSGAGTISFEGNGSLVVDQGKNTAFDGAFNGRGSLTKAGVGTLTLRGSAPEVDAEILVGVVLVDGGSLGPVIASQDGALSLRDNGTVGEFESPNGRFGNNASGVGRSGDFTLNFLYLQPISSQTNFGKLFVTGDVRLNQPLLDVNVLGAYHPNPGTKFIIVDNDGSDAVKGGFRQLQEGAEFETDGVRFRVSYVDGDGNDISLTVVGQPANPPDLTIDKQHTGDFAVGQAGTYRLVVSNVGTGSSEAKVVVTDTLPSGYVPTAASGDGWHCAINGQAVECTHEDVLAAGGTYPAITIVVQLSASAKTAVNRATVSGGGDVTPVNNTDEDPTTVVSAVDLKISKRAGEAFVHSGPASYTLDVENVGAGTTIGMVTVTDTMPADLNAIKASGDGWTCDVSGRVVTCTRTTAVAPGASFPPISIEATIPASAPDSLTNTATVAGGGDTVPGNNTATIVTPVGGVVTPDLTITKTHTPDTFTQGQTGTFTITVSNQGKGPTSGSVSVMDTLPAGFTGTAAGVDWTCAANAQSVTCTRSDSLPAGQSYPAIVVSVNVSATASTSTNTVTVSGGSDVTPGNNTANDAVTVTQGVPDAAPDLTISKSHAPGSVVQGGTVSFSIVVRNVGGASTTIGEVVVTDTLPAGLTPTTATGPGWSCVIAASTVTCRRSNALAAGGAFDAITLVASVSATAASTANTVSVTGGGDVSPGNNTDTDNVTIATVDPQLTINKSHEGNFSSGQQNIGFTIGVRNDGAAATRGQVTVQDTVPAGLTPIQASGQGWSCQIAGQLVTCTRSDALNPGAAHPAITLRANVAANAQSDVNIATVSGGGSDAQTDSDPYTVTGGVPNLTIGKSHTGDFTTGQIGAVYIATVRNLSATPTSGPVVMQDSLPPQLVPTAASGDGWTCTIQAQVVSCRRTDSLAGHRSWPSITMAVNVLALPGTLTNVATVSGGGDATPADNSAADPTTIVGSAQLSIRKSHPSPVLAGQSELQFTIDVLNNGSADTSGETRVTDEIPAGLLLKDVVGPGWSCQRSGATATCTRSDTLRPDKSFPPIFVTVDVAADAQSTVNRATVSGGGDTTPDDNVAVDNVVLTAPGQPNLTITKQHAEPFVQGQQGTYSVRVTNEGLAATIGTVTVSDDMPAGLTPRTAGGPGWSCGIRNQSVTCSRGDALDVGASYPDIAITVDVANDAGNVVNTAVVSGGGDSSTGDNTDQDSTTILARDPDLTVTKQHSDPFATGQTGAAYRITVSNVGTAPTAGEVVVSDGVPAGMRPVSAGGDGWSCGFDGQLMQCRRSDVLAPGASYPLVTLIVNVLPEASSVPNTVSVAGGGDGRTDNNTAVDYTNVNVVADPTISLTLNTPLLTGVDAVYEAQVTNLGPGRVGGKTEVVAQLPAGLLPIQGVGSGWTCEVRDRQIRCSRFGTLEANATFPDIALRARVRVAGGEVTVGAVVIPSQDSNLNNNQAEVTATAAVPVAAFVITKTASRPAVRVGETVTYRLEITNTGQIPVQQTEVRDLPPRGFTPVGASTSSSSSRSARESVADEENGELTWLLGVVQPQETVAIVYQLRVGADARGGPQDNRASVTGMDAARRVVTAGPAIATVDVLTDSFTMLQALVGRVYEDVDGDGQFSTADRPIPNARLITSTGQAAITDPAGLYNIPSLGAGSVAVSLDKDTLPPQLTTADEGPGGRSWTRLLRTPIGGGSLLLQNYPLKRAAGSAPELSPAVAAPGDGGAPLDEAMPESTAGSLPPRREYETRLGSSLLIALGELSVGRAAPEFDIFEEDDDAWGYGSIFYQGGFASPRNRLTLAYDSHRRLNGTSNRDRLFELDPGDRAYPVFGDTSQRQEFATSNAKIFARLERDNSHIHYGDLIGDLPSSDRDGGRWSSYQRHLTGGEIRLADATGNHVTVRGAQPTTAFARDTVATSGLGLIALTHTDVVAGTETIAVEVRDRRNPERLISRDVLARAVDYNLEPATGAVFLIRHINALDSGLNLVQIVATYEYRAEGLENMLYSGRAQKAFGGLRIGGTFFSEEGRSDGRFTVAGIDLEQSLWKGGRLRVDLPYSNGVPDVGATVEAMPLADDARADGLAAKVDLEQPIAFWRGTLRGSFLRADNDFRNPFSSTITPGAQLATVGAELAPLETSRLRIGVTDGRYDTEMVDASRTEVSAAWSQTIGGRVTLTGGYDARHLTQGTSETDSGLATAAAAVRIGNRFEARAGREQNVRDQDDPTYPDQTTLGARWKLRNDTNLFYTQRISDKAIVPVGDFTGTGLARLSTKGEMAVGVESRVTDTTRLVSGYEVEHGINGVDAFATIGAFTQVGLGRGFSGGFGAEHGTIVSGEGENYTSGTVALAWLKPNRFKATTRYDGSDRAGYSGVLSAGVAARLHGGLTGLVRTEWLESEGTAASGTSVGVLAALALRPVTNDRAGVLLSYQYLDRDAALRSFGPATLGAAWRHRLSTDGYLQPLRWLSLHGKFGWEQTPSGTTEAVSTYLGQGRAQFSLFRYIDAAIEERYIRQPSTNSTRRSTGAEIGAWPIADLRVALGYHFQDTRDPFGRDLQGAAKGFYGTVSTKLSRLFNLMGSTPAQ